MESPITIRYRINSHSGFLFVRELVRGEVVTRIPSEKSTLSSSGMDEVVRLCSHAFIGPIQSVSRDDDSIYVTCAVAKVQ